MPSYYKANLGMGREKRHITAAHIPGHKNINADKESRELSYDLEWMLCPKILHKALKNIEIQPRGRHVCKKYKLPVSHLLLIQVRSQS